MPATCIKPHEATKTAPAAWWPQATSPVAALCLLCFLLFFFRLGDRDLASSHEARAGQDAQSILNTGEWDLPRLFDGRVEMQKPPLFYWLVALFGALNGGEVDAWSVRLPAALSAFGCVFLLLIWGSRRCRPLAGYLAAAILATCLHFTALARTGRIDMPLTLTVSLTLVGFCEGIKQRRQLGGQAGWPWFLMAYLAIVAGVLLKGPIAIALPIAVGSAWWILHRIPRLRQSDSASTVHCSPSTTLLWGAPLVLALTLPWFLWANFRTDGEFFRVFFWHHNIDRGFGTDDQLRTYPWWFYGPRLGVDLLPWSLVLPVALWETVVLSRKRRDLDARFGAVWLLGMLVLLSAMRFKRADYLVPAFPGVAWMLGCTLERWYLVAPTRRRAFGFVSIVAVTAALWVGYIALVLPQVEATRTHRRFAEEVRRHTSERILFFWAEAHLLAFHVGQPLMTSVEWDDLDAWAGSPQIGYIVMPVTCLEQCPSHLKRGTLDVVAYSAKLGPRREMWPNWLQMLRLDTHERDYVLVRTHGLPQRPPNSYTKR